MLLHYHLEGFIVTEDCSIRALTRGRKDQQGTSLIVIITFKQRILSYYIDVALPNPQIPSEHREAFRETCLRIGHYRKKGIAKAHGSEQMMLIDCELMFDLMLTCFEWCLRLHGF